MHFEQLTENMELLIATSDQTGNAVYFNKAWENFTGRSKIHLLNFGWAELIHAEDRDSFVKLYLDSFTQRINWKKEFRVLDHSGEYRWLLATGTTLYENGVFSGYVSSSVDISEQMKVRLLTERDKQILRELVLTAPIGICVLDAPSLVAETVNASFLEIAGKPEESIIGHYYWDSFAEAAAYYAPALQQVLEKGESFYASEVALMLIRHGKPEDIYVTFVYTPLKNERNEVTKVIVWVLENTTQVTARHRVEELVAERTKDLDRVNFNLKKSNDELAQFAHIASHDLQEPLRKILAYSEMLQTVVNGSPDPRSANHLKKIISSAGRMRKLIIDVLDYSELSREKEEFEMVDLNVVASNVMSDYDWTIEKQGATLHFQNLPVIEASAAQMTQLFSNMISNSLKYVHKDIAPVLQITSNITTQEQLIQHHLAADQLYYTIQFSDNGIGMDPKDIEKIFDIFYRLHRKSEFEGTGIGLALCKKIALNHKGAIDAEGSGKTGAVFNVYLAARQNKAMREK
jgi:PAS domain S-box-containing protein